MKMWIQTDSMMNAHGELRMRMEQQQDWNMIAGRDFRDKQYEQMEKERKERMISVKATPSLLDLCKPVEYAPIPLCRQENSFVDYSKMFEQREEQKRKNARMIQDTMKSSESNIKFQFDEMMKQATRNAEEEEYARKQLF